jgi:hypothetical protein
MAMTVGSVTVDDDGTVTGSGMALAIFNAMAALAADLPPSVLAQVVVLSSGAKGTVETRNKQGITAFATALATGIVGYVQSNAVVTIGTETGALQTSTNNGDATDPPAVAVTLPVT